MFNLDQERWEPRRIEVETFECPDRFPEIRQALREIGGLTKFGKQRLDIEFGPEHTRPYGGADGKAGLRSAKYGLYAEPVVVGWKFEGCSGKWLVLPGTDPLRPAGVRSTNRDRMTLQSDLADYDKVSDRYRCFSDGQLRVAEPIVSYIDHPIPNWFVVDYFSAAQCGGGSHSAGYEGGAWIRIWQCHDPSEALAGPPYWGYRPPDATDLLVIREYWTQRLRDVEASGCDIDDPAVGQAVELQAAWMDRAVKHLKEEERGKNAEDFTRYLEEYHERARLGGRPFSDLGARNVVK